MSSHQSNISGGDLPSSYQPAPPVKNFAAPAHHLSNEQSKEVVALAEQSHRDTQGGFSSTSSSSGHHAGSGLTGSGSGFGTGATDNLASTLGGGTGSATRSHGVTGGEYERRGDDLTGNRTALTSGTGLGSSSHHDSTTSSSSHSHGLGSGAAGAGALGAAGAGAGVYGAGHGSHGDSNTRGGASAVAAKQSGKGGELTDHEFKNTAPSGTLESKLQDELERNARKAGTHATGFGVQGTPAGSASLGGSGSTGLTGNSTSTGYGTSGQQYGSQSGAGIGSGHHSSTAAAAPLGAAGVGAAGAGAGYGTSSSGLTGQQGYGQQSGYPAGATSAVGQTGTVGTGERLADQIHGLGTQTNVDVGKFGTMQDHTRRNNEL